jgi:hypothetical protein
MTKAIKTIALVATAFLIACTAAEVLRNVRTVADIAKDLCLVTGVQKTGLSVDRVAKEFCATEKQIAPWIGIVKDGQQTGAMATGMNVVECDAGAGHKCM